MYADYAFYTETYHGHLIESEEWEQYERESANVVDSYTYMRLVRDPSLLTDRVRMAVCAVAEVLKQQDEAETKSSERLGVKSFSNDGYQEAYLSVNTIRTSFNRNKEDAVNLWLPRSDPLRYAGFWGCADATCE